MARSEIGRTGARFGAPPSRHAPDPEYPYGRPTAPGTGAEADAEPVGADGPAAPDDGPEDLVGVTGARFGGHSAKRTRLTRRERAARRAAARAGSTQDEGVPGTDDTDGAAPAGGPAAPPPGTADTAPLPVVAARPAPAPGEPPSPGPPSGPRPVAYPVEPAPQTPALATVRPYVMTGGRTRVRAELRLETLVSVRPAPGPVTRPDSVERAAVLRICVRPRSVSEVAALAAVPLGVARVLIDDLASEGRVVVHGVSSAEDGPSVALMDRVLSGLRRL